jgi:hydroxymethylpyrimidine pyrophosphatase-like HAD family hydrolase
MNIQVIAVDLDFTLMRSDLTFSSFDLFMLKELEKQNIIILPISGFFYNK